MPNIVRDFQKDAYYHVYNRGFNRMPIFLQDSDYDRFLKRLDEALEDFVSIRIDEYCLLPNHFHFLLRDIWVEERDDLNDVCDTISKFMKRIELSHAMYFSHKYADFLREGKKMPMFEGRFKSKIILHESYGERIQYYISCNAVKHGLVKHPRDWVYSSFSDEKIFDKDAFNQYEDQFSSDFEL